MVQLDRLFRPAMYLSVILGSALTITASASVTGSLMQSIRVDPGGQSPVRSIATVYGLSPPADRVPAPLTPLPAPAEVSLVALAPAPEVAVPELMPAPTFVVTTAVNVRAAATKSAKRLSSLEAGERVSEVERDGSWVRVARDGVVLGWVFDRYLRATEE